MTGITRRWSTGRHEPRRWPALVTLCIAQFVTVLAFQGVAVVLPEVADAFGLSDADAQWVVGANAIAFGGLLLLAGRIGDLTGHRRLFAVGSALFAAGSLAGGIAPGPAWLVAARVLQGVGTALLAPASLALLADAFPDDAGRRRALAAWGAAGPLGGVAAVLLGGVLASVLGWRAVFALGGALALLPLALARFTLPAGIRRERGRIDPRSTITGAAGIALLVFGLGEATRSGLADLRAVAPILLGAALVAGFVAAERRTTAPLVPPTLRASGEVLRATVVAFLHGAATNTPIVFFALYLQQVRGASPLETGLGFIPCNLAIVAGSGAGARLAGRAGFRIVMAAGMAIVIAGLLALTTISPAGSYVLTLLPGLLGYGFGLGVAQVGIVGAATNAALEDRGVAGGMVTASAQVGTAVGLVLLVAASGFADGQVEGYRLAFLAAAALAALGVAAALLGPKPGNAATPSIDAIQRARPAGSTPRPDPVHRGLRATEVRRP